MPELASVNGVVTALDDAVVPINDRAVTFGDAVYEVAAVYHGHIFDMDRHLRRCQRNLAELGIDGIAADDLHTTVRDLLARSGLSSAVVYWQISRGVQPRDHVYPPAGLTPTVIVTVRNWRRASVLDEGVAAVTAPDQRWGRVDIKTVNLLPNSLARTAARRVGAFEAILISSDGHLREATASAVMVVREGILIGPPSGPWCLPSLTRQRVCELAHANGLVVAERETTAEELAASDEVILMGTTIEVVGVTALDGRPVGTGRVGPVTRQLTTLYREDVARHCPAPNHQTCHSALAGSPLPSRLADHVRPSVIAQATA